MPLSAHLHAATILVGLVGAPGSAHGPPTLGLRLKPFALYTTALISPGLGGLGPMRHDSRSALAARSRHCKMNGGANWGGSVCRAGKTLEHATPAGLRSHRTGSRAPSRSDVARLALQRVPAS